MPEQEPNEELGPGGAASPRAGRTEQDEPVKADRPANPPRIGAGLRLRERYVLERELGRGGMATVWLAHDERLERPVAVKVLADRLAGEPGYLERFKREVRVAAGQAHPNLVKIYDSGDVGGRPFLVMEYVPGGDLAGLLAAGQAPDPDRLARDLLAALRYIHEAGVLHRDVKTQNVLIGADGSARLTDFGIARPRDATSLTQTGLVLGTARYLAPEVLSGGEPSERSDLYSLGVVLGEVIEARPGSVALARLVDTLGSADPEARPASAPAALELLADPVATTPTAAEPVARARESATPTPRRGTVHHYRQRQPARRDLRRPLALAGLGASALAVLAIAALATGGGGGSDAPDPQPAGEERAAGSGSGGGAEGRGEAGSNGGGDGRREEGAEDQGELAAADGFTLNDRGYELVQQGRPSEAVPILSQAVDALEGSGDITYAYALYNLGHALRLAGRPEEAIPVLEARLEIPNQLGVVRKELEAAREEAGVGGDDERPGRGRGRGRDDD